MTLQGRKILLGVTGSIAAYKAAILTRLLVKAGAEVQLIMSASALDFITPLTLATLSKRPVLSTFQKDENGEWNNHVELGLWADLFLVAPITANTIFKFANGACDNLLTATYLSARCPVMIAPAMDLDMFKHFAVKRNLEVLQSNGVHVLETESGELASGLVGQGRMLEPEKIVQEIERFFTSKSDFQGKKVLITMGPTQEALDPVRFISNHSSGTMGLELAKAFHSRGAEVYIVSGPISLTVDKSLFHWNDVKSAKEMHEAAASLSPKMDICVFAAAVADYTPMDVSSQKIKKSEEQMVIPLVKNVDIAASLGKEKRENQIHIGFALETENEEENAKGKLARKNFDMIVLNSMNDPGAGFQVNTNKVRIFHKSGLSVSSELAPKSEIANLIIDQIKNIPVRV